LEDKSKRAILRFYTRRSGRNGKPMDIVHFYSPAGGKVFHARCERGIITGFLRRVNGSVRLSKTGKTLYLEGDRAEDILRRLAILAGSRQCVRSNVKIAGIAETVASLGEFETIFWYSKIIEEYERRGFWGVCRVAKAFRILHGID